MNYSSHILFVLLPLLLDKESVDKILAAESGPNLEQKLADIMESMGQTVGQMSGRRG